MKIIFAILFVCIFSCLLLIIKKEWFSNLLPIFIGVVTILIGGISTIFSGLMAFLGYVFTGVDGAHPEYWRAFPVLICSIMVIVFGIIVISTRRR